MFVLREAWDWYLQWTDNNNKYLASQIHNHKHISTDGAVLYLGGNIDTVNKQLYSRLDTMYNCSFSTSLWVMMQILAYK